ncbi:hypothetical protein QFZ76_008035 [Streptomyces sp. V4I2]|nr:hypothetical protein [Streptomyces sp. V4I2]
MLGERLPDADKSPTAAGPYVQPGPVASPAVTSAITTVVVSQAGVPSASGASGGTVYTDTTGRWSSLAGQDLQALC